MTKQEQLDKQLEALNDLALMHAENHHHNSQENLLVDMITDILCNHLLDLPDVIDTGCCLVEYDYRVNAMGNIWDFNIDNVMFYDPETDVEVELPQTRIDDIERDVNDSIDESNDDNNKITFTNNLNR